MTSSYIIELIQGIPYLVDKEDRIYYYNPEKPEAKIQLGNIKYINTDGEEVPPPPTTKSGKRCISESVIMEAALFDDWKERISSTIDDWRSAIIEHERGKIPPAKKPQKTSTKSGKTSKSITGSN